MFSISICSRLFMFLIITDRMVLSGWYWRACLFFMMLALLSSFFISTRTVPRIGWERFRVWEGIFLTALTTSLSTLIPGARTSARICLTMSRSVYPVGGRGRNRRASPSLSDISLPSPILASKASSLLLTFLISYRRASVSGNLEWMFSISAYMLRVAGDSVEECFNWL